MSLAPIVLLAATLAVGCQGAVRRAATAAAGPRAATGGGQAEIASKLAPLLELARRDAGRVPGALPAGFRYRYDDAYHGWPVLPLHAQHPIRGSFLDPRGLDENGLAGYHFGIDVNVDDRHPDPGAPRGLSHRVYAVEGGVVSTPREVGARTCGNRRLKVGHFAYWHVSPVVSAGQHVRAGEQIGWTCLGEWHVHLSEWARLGAKRVWVNPLHAGGKLAPYVDSEPPIVSALRFFTRPVGPWRPRTDLTGPDTARPLAPTRLHGPVELRAEIEDGQSFLGFLAGHPAWEAPHHPYRVAVEIRSRRSGAVVMRRVSFQSDQLPQTPYLVHFAPGTVQNGSMQECVTSPPGQVCSGTYWLRPFSRLRQELWNTRAVANGPYEVTVVAWDVRGNVGSLTVPVVVGNP